LLGNLKTIRGNGQDSLVVVRAVVVFIVAMEKGVVALV